MAVSTPTTVATYASTASVTTSGAVTATAGAASGAFVLVKVGGGGASQTFGVTDSLGNTYTPLTAGGIASGSASTVQMFYCFTSAAIVSGTTTFTVTKGASGGLEFIVDTYTGVDTTTPIGNSGTVATGTSTTAVGTGSTTSAVSAVAGGSVEALVVADITKTVGATSPMVAGTVATSSGTGNPRRIASLSDQTASAGSVTPSFTLTTSGLYGVVAIVLNPLASGLTGTASLTATLSTTATGANAAPGTASLAGTLTTTTTAVVGVSSTASLTTTLTVNATAAAHPTVALIGDSLTERQTTHAAPPTRQSQTTSQWLAAGVFPSSTAFYWYGKGGKGMAGADANGTTVAQNITAARAALGAVDKWVIALVTNNWGDADATFTAEVNAILNAIYVTGSEPDRVYWVNGAAMNGSNTNVVHYNPLLASAISAHAQAAKITYLDFNTYIHQGGVYDANDWLSGDIPHMTDQGYVKRDAYIASALTANAVGGAELDGVLTTTATGAVGVSGAATQATTLTATAAGTVNASSSASSTTTLTTTAVGAVAITGTATLATTLTTTASSGGAAVASATSNTILSATATGQVAVSGGVTATTTLAATATGAVSGSIGASLAGTLTASAVGVVGITRTATLAATIARTVAGATGGATLDLTLTGRLAAPHLTGTLAAPTATGRLNPPALTAQLREP